MGWQSRAKLEKQKEIDKTPTKEEKEEAKKQIIEYKESVKKEKNRKIENIDEHIVKSNVNLLFLSFRPIVFASIGMLFMLLSQNYSFKANFDTWPIVFLVVNILTILLMLPLMHMQRLRFKNVFKYKEKSFKWWQYVLLSIGLLILFFAGSALAELVMYGTFGERTSMLILSKFKVLDWIMLLLIPLTTIKDLKSL